MKNDAENTAASGRKNEIKQGLKYVLSAIIASILIISFLWGPIGSYSLLVLLIIPLFFLLWLVPGIVKRTGTAAAYKELVRMTGADADTAERLIMAEYIKGNKRTRPECIKLALEKLVHDRSR